MAKFKVGDRVKVINPGYSSEFGKEFTIAKVRKGYAYPYVLAPETNSPNLWRASGLELIEGGAMKAGDILDIEDGYGAKILAHLNQGVDVYLLSNCRNMDEVDGWYTAQEIKDYGWKLKDNSQQVEKSVADIEKELNLTPGTLRIRKDD